MDFFSGIGKIILSNLPSHARFEDLETLLSPFGSVQSCEKLGSRDGGVWSVQVSYETHEQAQQWVNLIYFSDFIFGGINSSVYFC